MYPDPILTANLYCADRLDEVLHRVVDPAWRAIRQHEPGAETYLWTLRSREGGEHLKLRLHGPASLADPARALLEQAAAHLDVSLVWTRYQRSHVWLGGAPFLDDDGYIHRITRCLAAACERVLLLESDATGRIPDRVRQGALLEGLIAGLAVTGFAADARPAYLEYHRDTLLRSRTRGEAGRPDDLLELFDRRIEAIGPAADALRLATGSVWTQDSTKTEPEGAIAAWCRALAHLVWYIRPLCEDPDAWIDPCAEDPCFVPVFKAFHGLANQLGLNPVEEAFEIHFLWTVGAPAPVHAAS